LTVYGIESGQHFMDLNLPMVEREIRSGALHQRS